MDKKIPTSQAGRARETRRQRKLSRMAKGGVAAVTLITTAMWGYLFLVN
ncbi:hypothetical protein [Tsuneonella amylolytica]|nr:hypothetical protein [Tsuneonella amylolytica]